VTGTDARSTGKILLLEVMAYGKPVVATNIEGYTTIVHDGIDGLLATPRDSESLTVAVGHLLENEPLRQKLIYAGLQTAREYAWPRVARRVFDYYCELLDVHVTSSGSVRNVLCKS
jgi:phosphatidyl-myo-inositol alpha-mannosyltransferase